VEEQQETQKAEKLQEKLAAAYQTEIRAFASFKRAAQEIQKAEHSPQERRQSQNHGWKIQETRRQNRED
jgi:hypothetical protein